MNPGLTGRQEQLFRALIEIGRELASTTNLDELLNRVLDIARGLFLFENALIRLLSDDGRQLVTAASYGYDAAATTPALPLGKGIMGQVALTGKPLLINDLSQARGYVEGIVGARSELAVPLVARERLVGVFNVESPKANAFHQQDLEFLEILGRQVATAIENARLYHNLRQVSRRFEELHQFNSRILKSVNLGIYTVDAELRITSWNPKMEEMSGVGESDALGQPLLSLFPRLEEEGVAERIRQVLTQGSAGRLRLAHRDLRGELRFQKRRIAPLKDNGRVSGAVVIVEDVTEFRRLLDQTIESEKLAELGRLSAGIAHEINNPLSVISYAAQLLGREDNLNEFQHELLARIDGEAERLKALTGGLLSFSRSGETSRRLVDLNELIGDVLRLLQYELARATIEVRQELEPLPLVEADPNKLKQVIINLVLNAVQALQGQGVITLASRTLNGDWVMLDVRDNGPGIAENILPKIFEPFFTTKQEGEGTGLGLYICRTIIHDHNGHLLVDSSPGQGCAFRVQLPLK